MNPDLDWQILLLWSSCYHHHYRHHHYHHLYHHQQSFQICSCNELITAWGWLPTLAPSLSLSHTAEQLASVLVWDLHRRGLIICPPSLLSSHCLSLSHPSPCLSLKRSFLHFYFSTLFPPLLSHCHHLSLPYCHWHTHATSLQGKQTHTHWGKKKPKPFHHSTLPFLNVASNMKNSVFHIFHLNIRT